MQKDVTYGGPFYKNIPYPPSNRIPPICLCSKRKHAACFPLWRERGNDDNSLSSLAVSPQNYEIFDFHTIDSPVFAGGWWKVECYMLEPGNNDSMWHFFLCVKDKNAKAIRREACNTFPVLERKGGPSAKQMGESRMLYVGPQESVLMYAIFLLYMKKPCATSTPCASAGGTPTCHIEVKAPTYIRSGCTDLRASSSHRP